MRVFSSDDFKKMARVVVNRFMDGTPLSDGIVKSALDNELNPDQIRNLVQMANTMAHMTLFYNKNDGDKIVEFSPADPKDVMQNVYKDEMPPEEDSCDACSPEKAMDMFGDLSSVVDKIKDMVSNGQSTSVETESTPTSPVKRQMTIIKIRKVAEALDNEKLETAHAYQDELDKVASEFAKLYGPDHGEFEKDALAWRGNAAVPVLNDIRNCLRMERISPAPLTKTARVVDTDDRMLQSLERLMKLASAYEDYCDAKTFLQEKVGGYL
jgi:hypothetical protein